MDTATIEVTAEDEIRGLFKSWANATRAKDIDAIMSHYAPDILSFDAISQLQFKGADAYRKHWQACLAMCPGAMIFEIHDLNITAGDGVAFGHCLLRCGATSEDGEEKAGWMVSGAKSGARGCSTTSPARRTLANLRVPEGIN